MMLSEVPYDEIQIGLRVRSTLTGSYGTVTERIPIELAIRKEDNELVVTWDNVSHGDYHGASHHWHFWFDKVEVV